MKRKRYPVELFIAMLEQTREFLTLLDRMAPRQKFVVFARGMFYHIWNGLMGQTDAKRKILQVYTVYRLKSRSAYGLHCQGGKHNPD